MTPVWMVLCLGIVIGGIFVIVILKKKWHNNRMRRHNNGVVEYNGDDYERVK